MENNLENKAKFFAQYWGQEVLKRHESSPILKIDNDDIHVHMTLNHFLELKPLSSITDREIIELQFRSEIKFEKIEIISRNYYDGFISLTIRRYGWSCDEVISFFYKNLTVNKYKYLQSRGYYTGDGLEIEYGWVKLKE